MNRRKVCLVGSSGQMGQAILSEISGDEILRVSEIVNRKAKINQIMQVDPTKIDVVIDFSSPEATIKSARYCAQHQLPLVTGTTGLNQKQMSELKKLAKKTAILWSANMNLAVNAMARILADFAEIIPDADIEIVEQHHRKKKDSPSGTALLWAKMMNPTGFRNIVCGRPEGESEQRASRDIVISSVRGGLLPGGSNEVRFLTGDQEIIFSHRTFSNQSYAQGAIIAAKWLIDKPVGFYSMFDVFGKKQ